MAIVITEHGARELGKERAERVYLITGTADVAAARTALLATAPTTVGTLAQRDAVVEEAFINEAEADQCMMVGRAEYGAYSASTPAAGTSQYNFEIGSRTVHITQDIATPHSYAVSGTAPDFKGAIGVTSNGPQGVDIDDPLYSFSETHILAAATVTAGFKANLFAVACAPVNDNTFKGFAAGEVRFLGATGAKRGDDDWEITFRFVASPNRTDIVVSTMTSINKEGWEYLDILCDEEEDSVAKRMVQRPIAAYVHQVYRKSSFALLGIGV